MDCPSYFFYNTALEECVSCRTVCEDIKKRDNWKYCKDMCKDFYAKLNATTTSSNDVNTTPSVPYDISVYWIPACVFFVIVLVVLILFVIRKKLRTSCQKVCCQRYINVQQGNERQVDPAEQATLTLEETGDNQPQPDSGIDSSYTETETSVFNSMVNIPLDTIEPGFVLSEMQVTDRYLKLASELRTSN